MKILFIITLNFFVINVFSQHQLSGTVKDKSNGLSLRYNFGSTTVRAARNKSTGIEDETSRAGTK